MPRVLTYQAGVCNKAGSVIFLLAAAGSKLGGLAVVLELSPARPEGTTTAHPSSSQSANPQKHTFTQTLSSTLCYTCRWGYILCSVLSSSVLFRKLYTNTLHSILSRFLFFNHPNIYSTLHSSDPFVLLIRDITAIQNSGELPDAGISADSNHLHAGNILPVLW